jgi:pimeloyl-ACP methyl ester carboxylesterase
VLWSSRDRGRIVPHELSTGSALYDRARHRPVRPVTFNGCFGWLHWHSDGPGSDTAVLLCAGLTQDKLYGHRPFRQLADALMAEGYPTLRFDYLGSGDSCDAAEAEHWSLWQRSIEAAIDYLKTETGIERIVLIGIRIGATLAARVAEGRSDVVGLALLEPVLRGQSYVRQLSIEVFVSRADTSSAKQRLDTQELLLSTATLRHIRDVELIRIRPPRGCRVLVCSRSQSASIEKLADTWRLSGNDVVCDNFEGLEPFLRPTFMNHEASMSPEILTNWIDRAIPMSSLLRPAAPQPDYTPLKGEQWVETPLLFGPQQRLFGILCRPTVGAGGLVVVTGSSSGDPHFGHGRQAVEFARRMAAQGIASFRMDFAGIGDSRSPGVDAEAPTHVFEHDRTPDISSALDALGELGFRRFALQGMCSGAYHALQAAVVDRRVDILLLINLAMFTWRKGDLVENVGLDLSKKYVRKLVLRETWIKLLRRRIDFRRLGYDVRHNLISQANQIHLTILKRLKLKSPDPEQSSLAVLNRRNVKTLFFFSLGDPGIDILNRELKKPGANLKHAEVMIMPGLDHALSRHNMRQIAADGLMDYLARASVP